MHAYRFYVVLMTKHWVTVSKDMHGTITSSGVSVHDLGLVNPTLIKRISRKFLRPRRHSTGSHDGQHGFDRYSYGTYSE